MKFKKACFGIFAVGLTINITSLACATTLTLFGPGASTTTTSLPAGPPDPAFTNSSLFDFNDFFRPTFGTDSPNPLPRAAFKESELAFALAMDGGIGPSGPVDPIVASQTFQFSIQGSFWSILGKLEFSPATTIFIRTDDVLRFSGDVVHRVAPHAGEFAPGDAIPFDIELNGGKSLSVNRPIPPGVVPPTLPDDLRAGVDGNAKNHPGGNHDDVIFGAFIGQVRPNLFFNDFQNYQGELDGFHTPEPSTWMLFVAGLALLVGLRRKIFIK
jgi:hypothetical protein